MTLCYFLCYFQCKLYHFVKCRSKGWVISELPRSCKEYCHPFNFENEVLNEYPANWKHAFDEAFTAYKRVKESGQMCVPLKLLFDEEVPKFKKIHDRMMKRHKNWGRDKSCPAVAKSPPGTAPASPPAPTRKDRRVAGGPGPGPAMVVSPQGTAPASPPSP